MLVASLDNSKQFKNKLKTSGLVNCAATYFIKVDFTKSNQEWPR